MATRFFAYYLPFPFVFSIWILVLLANGLWFLFAMAWRGEPYFRRDPPWRPRPIQRFPRVRPRRRPPPERNRKSTSHSFGTDVRFQFSEPMQVQPPYGCRPFGVHRRPTNKIHHKAFGIYRRLRWKYHLVPSPRFKASNDKVQAHPLLALNQYFRVARGNGSRQCVLIPSGETQCLRGNGYGAVLRQQSQ